MWEQDFIQTAGFCFLLSSVNIISHHVLSTFFCPSQAHGSGGPEELHLLAESEPRCHCVRRAGFRYVQSASQTAVMGRRQTPPSSSLCWLCPFPSHLKDSQTLADPWPCPLLQFTCTTKKMLRKTILYALKQQCLGCFMWKRGQF